MTTYRVDPHQPQSVYRPNPPGERMSISERRARLGRMSIYIEPRDAWIGIYVDPRAVYVCPLPFLVLRWAR